MAWVTSPVCTSEKAVLGVLDGLGNLAGMHLGEGFRHRLDVLGQSACRVVAEQCAEALRHAHRRNDIARDVRNVLGALACHDDVLVVRQDDDLVGIRALHRIHDVLRGRVHGLAARHHDVDAQALENRGIAGTGGNGHHAKRLVGCNAFGLELLVALDALQVHVVDMHLEDLTALEEVREHKVRRIGMHVHLEARGIAHAQLAIAHGGQEAQRIFLVEGLGIDQELVAVAVLAAFPVVDVLDLDLGLAAQGRNLGGELETHEGARESVEEDGQAEAARVDDVVLLQHGKQVGGAVHRFVRLGDDVLQGLVGLQAVLRSLVRSVGRIAQHGEDGSLDGLAHRLKGDFLGAGESRVERFGVQRGGIAIALAETAQNLRGDNARVATSTHERALRDGPANPLPPCARSEPGWRWRWR